MSRLQHITRPLAEANDFVRRYHRHHPAVIGHKFSLGATLDDILVGVAIVGRPVRRMRDDRQTLEVTRLCTDGTRNACSFLYGRAARATFALGYTRIGTYTTPSEGGASLRAAGWKLLAERPARIWRHTHGARANNHEIAPRLLWEISCLHRPPNPEPVEH